MTKKFLSPFVSAVVIVSMIGTAYAAEPKTLFDIDCDTLNKDVKVGIQSDPDDPNNGPEIIAYEFTLTLEPSGSTSIADLENAKIEENSAYSNMIVAQNTSSTQGNTRVLKIAAGFTQQTGVTDAEDLFFIENIEQKEYKITVTEGKLFPKSGGDDIYDDTEPKQTFEVDPSSCDGGQQTTTTDNTANTNTGNTNTSGQNNQTTNNTETTIELTSSVQKADPGAEVIVTAVIENISAPIDWAQTAGTRIDPRIQNQSLPDNKTQSELSFTMPTPASDITLSIKVGEVTETITIDGADQTTANAAGNDQSNQTETTDSTTDGTDSLSLQERLEQRRNELQDEDTTSDTNEPSGTIHNAAGANLAQSGPGDTVALALISLFFVYTINKRKKKEVFDS